MARQTRKISRSGIYHVILRGVNKQRIFEQSEDYDAMYRILHFVRTTDTHRQPAEEPNYFLYAYCIMDNHIHLLIQPNNQELGQIMKRIMTTYAIHFNTTYERIGHLFQDRFKSEPVEDENYFFTVLNYIHNNPVKAGLVQQQTAYRYSSCIELTQESSSREPLCCFPDLSDRLEMNDEYDHYVEALRQWEENGEQGPHPRMRSMNLLGISPEHIRRAAGSSTEQDSMAGLFERIKQKVVGSDSVLCQHIRARLEWQTAAEKDQAIVETLLEMTGVSTITEFQRLDKPTMRTALAIVRDSGVGDTKLSRLTGVSRGVIQRAHVYSEKIGK